MAHILRTNLMAYHNKTVPKSKYTEIILFYKSELYVCLVEHKTIFLLSEC